MADAVIIGMQEFFSTDPARRNKQDVVITYEYPGKGANFIIMPLEDVKGPQGKQKISDAIRKKEEEFAGIIGSRLNV